MLLAAASMTLTKDVNAQGEPDAAVVTYEKEFFEKYSPVTLLDILERIPGIQDILKQNNDNRNDRGFGSSGDQILLNSKRISTKSNSIRDILSRTTASQVEKIELIRGARDGLDVQSEGLVVNVILNEDASAASIFWKVGATYMVGEDFTPEFESSYKDSTGNLEYTISAEGQKRHGFFFRDEVFFDEANTRTGTKDLNGDYHFNEIELNSNLTYSFNNGDAINLNGMFKPIHIENDQYHVETGEDAETLYWDFEEDFIEWELGGDYTTNLGSFAKLKTLFLLGREVNSDFGTKRYNGVGQSRYLYNDEIIEFATSEDIFRASLTKNLNEKQSLEFGGEGAFNRFRQKFDNYERDEFEDPIELVTSNNIKIKESRYEVFAHYNYTVSPKLALQASLTTEFSRIVADTILPDSLIRTDNSFTFVKPRLNISYDVTDRDQLRLIAEKKVSQLEFFHYLTFFDQQEQELKFGNNNIRPEQIWEFSATFEHRLANDGGTLEAKFFYHDYKDYIARIDFSDYMDFNGNLISADAFFALPPDIDLRDEIDFSSKSGNIDHANIYGLTIKSNTRLGFIGLKDAQLGLTYEFERKRYFDPISQRTRNFSWSSDHDFTINFRHDLTNMNLSYGFEAEFRSGFQHGDIAYMWLWQGQEEYEIFVEKNVFQGIKLRLEASQQGGTNAHATYYRYRDHIRFNEPNGRDEQMIDRPYEISIELSGTL